MDKAFGVLNTVLTNGIKPDTAFCKHLLRVTASHKDIAKMESIVAQMKRWYILPDKEVYAITIKAYAAKHQWSTAVELLRSAMQENVIDADLCHTIVASLVSNEYVVMAGKIVGLMEDKGLMPHKATYNALLDGYKHAGMTEEVAKLHKTLHEYELDYLGGALAHAVQKLRETPSALTFPPSDKPLDSESCISLIAGCAAAEKWDNVKLYFDHMRARKFKYDIYTACMGLQATARVDPNAALQLFARLNMELNQKQVLYFGLLDGLAKGKLNQLETVLA